MYDIYFRMEQLKPLKDNLILKVSLRKSAIILTKENDKVGGRIIENIEVFAIGPEVEKVKIGDRVMTVNGILNSPIRIIPKEFREMLGLLDFDNEVYLYCNLEEIVGVIN